MTGNYDFDQFGCQQLAIPHICLVASTKPREEAEEAKRKVSTRYQKNEHSHRAVQQLFLQRRPHGGPLCFYRGWFHIISASTTKVSDAEDAKVKNFSWDIFPLKLVLTSLVDCPQSFSLHVNQRRTRSSCTERLYGPLASLCTWLSKRQCGALVLISLLIIFV